MSHRATTRFRALAFSDYEIALLIHVCEVSGLDAQKVTKPVAEALLRLFYTPEHRRRGDPRHVLNLLALARQILSMLMRCEIEELARRDDDFCADACRLIFGDPLGDTPTARHGLFGEAHSVLRIVSRRKAKGGAA